MGGVKIEYKVVNPARDSDFCVQGPLKTRLDVGLNKLGEDGWMLCSIVSQQFVPPVENEILLVLWRYKP
jgi:hypothetical protein